MAHTLDVERLDEIFDEIEGSMDKLSKWEEDFVTSVKDQYDRKGSLSERQLEVLEKIYVKV